ALWAAKDRFDGTAAERDIAIDCSDALPGVMADADESALTAILGHLVENAVSFTQKGGAVRLSVEAGNDTLRLIVSDNGPGIATEELARILEPFEQGGRSTHDHPAGGGLGLTLAKAYCELHGGTLTLQSAKGAGFTAIAELPRAE
ncbi:MAG: ATP-binding protein, partial [Rhizomicrobium sp.]|nr:ATP-binding protein [Rhizomicrobium sp.]